MTLEVTNSSSSPSDPGMPLVQRTVYVPRNVRESISSTMDAGECFVNQRFSGALQAFMAAYVNTVYSNYSVYQE